MKWLFNYRRDLVVCYVFVVLFALFIKYDFQVDAERMIVKRTREMLRNICVDGLKNVWHDTSSVENNCQFLYVTISLTNRQCS